MGTYSIDPSKLLRSLGMKVTKNREQVIRILSESKRPLNHQEIMERLPKDQSWDRVTIYRTLSDLEAKNVVSTMHNQNRITFFELTTKDSYRKHNHSHIICDKCGKIECISQNEMNIPQSINGFKVSAMEVNFHGICKECQ